MANKRWTQIFISEWLFAFELIRYANSTVLTFYVDFLYYMILDKVNIYVDGPTENRILKVHNFQIYRHWETSLVSKFRVLCVY